MRFAILAIAMAFVVTHQAQAKERSEEFLSCLAGIKQAATAAGIKPEITELALKDVKEPAERVLKLSEVQPETKYHIWDYLGFLVDDQRIADGNAKMADHDETLRAVENRFGVNRFVVAAVWGVETDYGRATGRNFLPHALTTLVCKRDHRTDFWRKQLIAALQLVERGDLELEKLYGSWAGAFGQTQFIPTTYEHFAIDMDGDGKRDLVDNVPDALGSTANYLLKNGWQPGQSWLIEVKLPKNYTGPTGRKNKASLATWAQRGVTRWDGSKLKGGGSAGLMLLAGKEGPAFLTFKNFDAIWTYNRAESYALAISHLADRMAGQPAFRTPWPTDDLGLSRANRFKLQELLIAEGYNIGEADGKIGSKSQAAIRKAEEKLGWEPSGRAGEKIFKALGGKI